MQPSVYSLYVYSNSPIEYNQEYFWVNTGIYSYIASLSFNELCNLIIILCYITLYYNLMTGYIVYN